MPAEFLHTYTALHVSKALGLLKRKYFPLIVLGSQGPDPFLYVPFDRDIHSWSEKLHKKEFQIPFLKNLGEALRQQYPYFAIAFMSHYVLDNMVHPYIIARAGHGIEHGQLERAIDRSFLDFLGLSPENFKMSKLLPQYIPYNLDIAFKDTINKTDPEKPFLAGYFTAAFRYMKLYHSLYDTLPIAMEGFAYLLAKVNIDYLLQGLKRVPFKDPLNIERRPWKYNKEIHYEDVISLVKMSIEKAIEIGRAYLNGSPLVI